MKSLKSGTASKEKRPLSGWKFGLEPHRPLVIVIAIFLQLCAPGAARRHCAVNRKEFTALDNSMCLPLYYKDINETTVRCSPTVKVLLSCFCLEEAEHAPGTLVPKGRYCLSGVQRTGEYTANLSIGLCEEGGCNNITFNTPFPVDLRYGLTAEILNLPVLPRCTRNELHVTDSFRPVASCERFCVDRDNMPLNDGSPCAMEWHVNVFQQLRVGYTGRCQNGICMFWPQQAPRALGCLDQEFVMNPNVSVTLVYSMID